MKPIKILSVLTLSIFMMTSCGVLKAPTIKRNEPIQAYRYFYINPTSGISSSTSGLYGSQYGVYGSSTTNSVVPSDVISGTLFKHGFARLQELKPELLDETLIVNYGESGRRFINLGYAIEVTIQFLSANNQSIVCVCTAEGQGLDEADDVRIAINRALKALFE